MPYHSIHIFSVSLHLSESVDTGWCPHCVTENDPTFTYCRNCLRPLSEA